MTERNLPYIEQEPRQSQTVLIVGSASGIGRATTERLAQDTRFSSIFAADINPDVHATFPQDTYPTVHPLELDIRESNQIMELVRHVHDQTGRIDVLVNSAGVVNRGRWQTYFDDKVPNTEFVDLWETNLMGPLTLMHAVLPHMREQGSGTVINITSLKYAAPDPFSETYAHVKQLLATATHNNRSEEAANDIHIVDVQPGAHQTGLDRGVWTQRSDASERRAGQFLYCFFRDKFGGNPDQVAATIHKIAIGELDEERVFVGWDARLCGSLYEHLPFWENIFQTMYEVALRGVESGIKLSEMTYADIARRHPDWNLPAFEES